MVKKCVICKVEQNASESRSFHKFPMDDALKTQWMHATGLLSVAKSSLICSDHFDDSSFDNRGGLYGCAIRRRLLAHAVPKNKISQGSNVLSDVSNSNFNSSSCCGHNATVVENCLDNKSNIRFDNTSVVPTSTQCIDNSNETTEKKTLTDESEMCASTGNATDRCKRKLLLGNDPLPKRIRFTTGFKTEYFSRNDCVSDESWNRFLRYHKYKNRLLKSAHNKNTEKQKKIRNIKDLIKNLKEKQLFSAAQYLQDLPPHVREMIIRMKHRKATAAFPAHLKNFARTLHYHSPSAYEYVRKSFFKCLPCYQTLNSWICSKNYKPGISTEVIEHVSNISKEESSKGKKLVFNITFDEVHIKKCRYWDKNAHEWKGVVDTGGQLTEVDKNGQTLVANKALVFMLVNINGNFKAPVAYYLINSLNGEEKSIILKDLLIKLSESKIDVVSITFDGDSAHTRACEFLGANLNYSASENFEPFFEHPATRKPVYIFYDPCHMLKLVRNYFALKGPLICDTEKIDWEYIKRLNDTQVSEGLHCACKITARHVNFANEKMKVFLAAQILSNSLSSALHFLEFEIKDPKFKNASATARFCLMFNNMFDMLNSRNKFCKTPTRKCITRADLPEMKKKIDEYINYIKKLEIDTYVRVGKKPRCTEEKDKENIIYLEDNKFLTNKVRKSVVECHSVKVGFLGFIISLKNLYNLCTEMIENNIVEYVLSYKISQDHIEMFFALIRRMNGFNNNPTSIQFTSAYKKLLLHKIDISVSVSANCKPQDETLLICDQTKPSDIKKLPEMYENNSEVKTEECSKEKKRIRAPREPKVKNLPVNDFLHNDYTLFEHDYTKKAGWCSTEYIDEVVKHVSGSIVFSLKNKIHCKQCIAMIEGNTDSSSNSKLTKLKNRGGLHFASDDVNFICISAEKILRQNRHLTFSSNIMDRVVMETLKILPNTILDDGKHSLEQDPLCDHRH